MHPQIKQNVPAVTGVLTILSLAFVFGAALRIIPSTVLPYNSGLIAVIPHLNAVISLTAIVLISAGWYFIRNNAVEKHRYAMVTSFGLFVAFLGLYLYRVTLEGPSPFLGPDAIKTYVYLPLLAVHILLAIVCIPLLYYVLLLAVTRPVSEVYATNHRRVARIAAPLWLVSFALGVVVYVMLHVVY
ncbi:DUF420 domain-containing protein [Halocatena pleomorpha]|uniref:DUF420 domain-containing protein n=1 Tax=Halocatena pleomorpha TaxID=1785090 RepID=A0A3P3R2H2_9EURY|nr:DUF420 domain-containing protein [Halocatena pleomorpha]RRJ27671.1 DUF420 domain-containing protein [Halocatena pleomorpha]